MKLYLDDTRPIPPGYSHLAKSVNDAIDIIEFIELNNAERIELLDLDHDLGDYTSNGGDGICLLDYLVNRETFYPIKLHTMNPVGKTNMEKILSRYWVKRDDIWYMKE